MLRCELAVTAGTSLKIDAGGDRSYKTPNAAHADTEERAECEERPFYAETVGEDSK